MAQTSETKEQGPLHQFFGPEFGATRWGLQQRLKLLSAFQSEVLRFATKRAQQNFEFFWGLTRCGNAQDLLTHQQQWCSEVAADYAEEGGRMFGLGTDLAAASLHPLTGLTCNNARAPEIRRAA
jgi:hypothetical protein